MNAGALLLTAAAIDATLGEPPNPLHPVVWMGTSIQRLVAWAPLRGRAGPFTYGLVLAIALPALWAFLAFLALDRSAAHPLLAFAVGVFLLKSSFSLRGLGRAARVVQTALLRGDLASARFELRSLCSRDASALDEPLLAAAVVESVAENASDSFVAPLFYFALFGIPGAVFYRAVNTLDAMIGYRGKYEWLGKASARLDDLLNLIPARLTAALLLVAGKLLRLDLRGGWRVLRRDGQRTESPNAGLPMATMAGLLRVRLEKRGCYALGDALDPIGATTIDLAWRTTRTAALLAVFTTALALEVRFGIGR
ncbi:MAG TPA: adenosylcobinamide-phosphate synthase CbiB [Polyangiaceae bacterium]|jgi:adenosylcobinamide-phosphate synthase